MVSAVFFVFFLKLSSAHDSDPSHGASLQPHLRTAGLCILPRLSHGILKYTRSLAKMSKVKNFYCCSENILEGDRLLFSPCVAGGRGGGLRAAGSGDLSRLRGQFHWLLVCTVREPPAQ